VIITSNEKQNKESDKANAVLAITPETLESPSRALKTGIIAYYPIKV